jgi:hypothetical protein
MAGVQNADSYDFRSDSWLLGETAASKVFPEDYT